MKKVCSILIGVVFLAACNNSGDSKNDNDTVSLEQNTDRNNRNTTVYDSGGRKQEGDTSSYERMPTKMNDSISR